MAKSGTAEGEGLLLLLLGFYFLGRAYNYGLLFCSTPADMIKIFLELLSGMFACPNDYNPMWVGKGNKL